MAKPISLDEWRLRKALTYRALGDLIGVRINLAFAYCQEPGSGQFKCPRADRMCRIYFVTNGEVRPDSFYKLPKLVPGSDPLREPELGFAQPRAAA